MEKELKTRAKTPIYRERILDVLRKADRPLYIAEIQRLPDIKDWHSARGILYRLNSEGLVRAIQTKRELLFQMAEPSVGALHPFVATMPEIAELLEKPEPKVKVRLMGKPKHGALLLEKGDNKYETNPADWVKLTEKYPLESIVENLEKGLRERGFPIKQGELLPEMKKVLKK